MIHVTAIITRVCHGVLAACTCWGGRYQTQCIKGKKSARWVRGGEEEVSTPKCALHTRDQACFKLGFALRGLNISMKVESSDRESN